MDFTKELRFKYLEDKLVPLVGAGSSKLLGIPEWEPLVKGYYDSTGCKLGFEKLCHDHQDDWAVIAEEIYDNTGSNHSLYIDFLAKCIIPTESGTHDLPLCLVQNFKLLITTNIDSTFDRSHKRLKTLLKDRHRELIYPGFSIMEFNSPAIAYIHGKMPAKSAVFKTSDYRIAYGSHSPIKALLSAVLKRYSLLFVAFSFRDKVFRDNLLEIIRELKKACDHHKKNSGGYEDPNLTVKDMYALFPAEDMVTSLTNQEKSDCGFSAKLYGKFFTNDGLLKPDVNYSELENELNSTLGAENATLVLKRLNELKRNKTILQFFDEVGMKIISYQRESRIRVIEILDEIAGEATTSDDLSSANKMNNDNTGTK